jgi:hypothetical protein
MTSYSPPRGADGKILIASFEDEVQPAEPVLRTAPVGQAPARAAGDMPTSFDSLRPGGATVPKTAPPSQRQWLAIGAGVALAVLGALALRAQGGPAPVAQPTAQPAPATAAPVPTSRPMLERAVAAFDAPGGTVVGALDTGRCYTLSEERDGWRHLDVCGSGLVWVRAWEMDGVAPPVPTEPPPPTAAPIFQPAAPVVVQPVGPAVTCVPVVDGDNGNAYLGDACGTTSEERQQRALELLAATGAP